MNIAEPRLARCATQVASRLRADQHWTVVGRIAHRTLRSLMTSNALCSTPSPRRLSIRAQAHYTWRETVTTLYCRIDSERVAQAWA
jgi:hypothetical protein